MHLKCWHDSEDSLAATCILTFRTEVDGLEWNAETLCLGSSESSRQPHFRRRDTFPQHHHVPGIIIGDLKILFPHFISHNYLARQMILVFFKQGGEDTQNSHPTSPSVTWQRQRSSLTFHQLSYSITLKYRSSLASVSYLEYHLTVSGTSLHLTWPPSLSPASSCAASYPLLYIRLRGTHIHPLPWSFSLGALPYFIW